MSRPCLIFPAGMCAHALAQVLNVLGPPRFRVAAPRVPPDCSEPDCGAPVDGLLLTGVNTAEVSQMWRFAWSVRGGDLSSVDVRRPVSRLTSAVGMRGEGLQSLPETAVFLVSVLHSVFKNDYLLEGRPGVVRFSVEYPHWLAVWRSCAATHEPATLRLLEHVAQVAAVAKELPDSYRSALIDLVGNAYAATRSVAARYEGA